MRRGSMLGLALLACLLALTGGAGPAGAASQTATAPEQLVHAYPLGPQRLCCGGHTSTPRSSPASKQRSGPTARRGGSQGGLSSAIWIAAVAGGALLTAAAAGGIYITRQRFSGIATQVAGIVPPHRGTGVLAPGHGDERRYPAGDFNLGVLLHERQDYAAAAAAYRRAELLGDNDAAFNLGVLLYETGDLAGAEAAWLRCARSGHAQAAANLDFVRLRQRETEGAPRVGAQACADLAQAGAGAGRPDELAELAYRRGDHDGDASASFNLGVLLHERRDFAGAAAAYLRSEQRGENDAAFNLGVLLYETGDLAGAEAAWRRCMQRGHISAAANLGFLLERRGDRQGASIARRAAGGADPV